MKLSLRRRKLVDPLESGSLSDLAFLLIIYFIVIAGFNVNMGYLLNLPSRDSQRIVNTEDLVRLKLDSKGILEFSGIPMPLAESENKMRQALQARPNLTVVLTIHPESPWQSVVDIIGMAQRSGVVNFSFMQEEL